MEQFENENPLRKRNDRFRSLLSISGLLLVIVVIFVISVNRQRKKPAGNYVDVVSGTDDGNEASHDLASNSFDEWFRASSANQWFGSSTFATQGPPKNKKDFLTKADCAAAEDAGLFHISSDCHYECEPCDESFYRYGCTRREEGVCRPCEEAPLCAVGSYRIGCGGLSEGRCVPCPTDCPDGYYTANCWGASPGSCAICRNCGAGGSSGRYLNKCQGIEPGFCRDCENCGLGRFLAGCFGRRAGGCHNCSRCGDEEAIASHCSADTDTTCQPCSALSICGEGEYRAGCGGGAEGACTACAACAWGTFRSGCTGLSPGVCAECGACPVGQYRSACGVGAAGGGPGECAACDENCGAGYFRDGCGGLEAGGCRRCGACPSGSYRAGCGGLLAGTCVLCAGCADGLYRRGCGETDAGECVPCGLGLAGAGDGQGAEAGGCGAGEYLVGCGGLSPGECRPCPDCAGDSYLVGCGGRSAGDCRACGACAEDQYEARPCGAAGRNRTCGPCAELGGDAEDSDAAGERGDEGGEEGDGSGNEEDEAQGGPEGGREGGDAGDGEVGEGEVGEGDTGGTVGGGELAGEGEAGGESDTGGDGGEVPAAARAHRALLVGRGGGGGCGTGRYRVGCGGGPRGRCVDCAGCPAGAFRVGCGGLARGECRSCGPCPAGSFRAGCGGPGDLVGAPGVCAECAACPLGHFRAGCGGPDPGACQACGACGAGEYELTPCGGDSGGEDRVCRPCGALPRCDDGQFRAGCGGGAAGRCLGCGVCGDGFFRVGCGGLQEGVCVACGNCPVGQYRQGCGLQSAGVCMTCPECDAGLYSSGCEGQHRGACLSCASLPPCPPRTERRYCGGASPGRCVPTWQPDTPPLQAIIWSRDLDTTTASTTVATAAGLTAAACMDDGSAGQGVERRFPLPGAYLRLGQGCHGWSAAGTSNLPARGDWVVSFFVGVPQFRADAAPRPAGFPYEAERPPDSTDTLNVSINGQWKVYGTVGDALLAGHGTPVAVLVRDANRVDFNFAFRSGLDSDHLHMLVSPGSAAFAGDREGGLPTPAQLDAAGLRVGPGTGRVTGEAVNAVDGAPLEAGAVVRDGYGRGKETIKLRGDGGVVLRILLGTGLLKEVQTGIGGSFDVPLPAGAYACVATLPGFYPFMDPDCLVEDGKARTMRVVMSPLLMPGDLRAVLVWGPSPLDLDLGLEVAGPDGGAPWPAPGLHVSGRGRGEAAGGGTPCEVSYMNQECADGASGFSARLDHDTRYGLGPETLTVEWGSLYEGHAILRVTDFNTERVDPRTNRDPALLGSRAAVDVYGAAPDAHDLAAAESSSGVGGGLGVRRFTLGRDGYAAGSVWMVFRLEAASRRVAPCTPQTCPLAVS